MVRLKRRPRRVLSPADRYIIGAYLNGRRTVKKRGGRIPAPTFLAHFVSTLEENTGLSWGAMDKIHLLRLVRVPRHAHRVHARAYKRVLADLRRNLVSVSLFETACLFKKPLDIEWSQQDVAYALNNL